METINLIFENYAGELIVRFFSSSWESFLMLKQVMFSFLISIPDSDQSSGSWNNVLHGISNFHSLGSNLKDLNFVEFLKTITQLGPDIINESNNTVTDPILKNVSNGTI